MLLINGALRRSARVPGVGQESVTAKADNGVSCATRPPLALPPGPLGPRHSPRRAVSPGGQGGRIGVGRRRSSWFPSLLPSVGNRTSPLRPIDPSIDLLTYFSKNVKTLVNICTPQ